ncbi:MAG: ECF transporter S component [Micrococcaceae bacterium]
MTMFNNSNTPSMLSTPALPDGDVIARYKTYEEAQAAVDYLADHEFPVQLVSIVGSDLKQVERVMGRLTMSKVALSGAMSGGWLGIFGGFILSLGSDHTGMIPAAIAIGAAMGVMFSVGTYALRRGKRDFTSLSQVVAGAYEVIVDSRMASEASTMLHQMEAHSSTETPTITHEVQSHDIPAEVASTVKEQEPQESKPGYEPLEDGRPRFGARLEDEKEN